MQKKIKITELNSKKVRVDKYLVDVLKDEFDFSRSMIQKMINDGKISLNKNAAKANDLVNVDDELIINIDEPKKSEILPENNPINIVYEDEDLAIIEKPNNMVVHPSLGNNSGTLVNALMYQMDDLSGIGGIERPGIVHRLDKQTTGLLLIAKNDKTHKALSKMIANREIKKEYVALVSGMIDENKGLIDAPIGRSESDRKKMDVTAKNSKKAVTHFEVLDRYNGATLVKIRIDTGRTHQIRVHFKYINHPVLNDPQYGRLRDKITDFGQYLHAYKLSFKHPSTGKMMTFESPMPKEFNDKIEELKKGE